MTHLVGIDLKGLLQIIIKLIGLRILNWLNASSEIVESVDGRETDTVIDNQK